MLQLLVRNNQTTISTSSHSCSPEQIIESHSEEIPDSNVHGQPENTNNLPISRPICDASDSYQVSSSSTDDNITQHIDDHVIDEGDEHNRQIMGTPLASMMTIENSDTFNGEVYVAPAKWQKPLSIISNSNFEAMSNPD